MPETNQEALWRRAERILPTVTKPGRYVGGELNQVVKDWDKVRTHVALVFPDIYDLGQSNLGLMLLYDILNRRDDIAAERAFSPWLDMESALRENDIPLYSLESKRALADFNIIGVSLPYETLYTNFLNVLDLAHLPLRSAERDEAQPLIIAGGQSVYNPEPVAPFVDAFAIGEGEEIFLDVIDAYQAWQATGESKRELLATLATIPGIYVPSLYQVDYHPDGTIAEVRPTHPNAALPVLKRINAKLPPPLTRFLVPNVEVVQERVSVEIMRGCTRGCRFCHAGMINRPVRERPVEEILTSIERLLDQTGYEEVGLLSLSSSDYSHILELVKGVNERFAGRHVNISLPSLRIESFSVELMDLLKQNSNRGGFTLAPEAATERMRAIINKPVSTEQLLETAREIYSRGWHTIKLYFMIGHPDETLEDVQAIADLCKAVLREGQEQIGKRASVLAGVGTFIPKPHTPFQWVPADMPEMITAKQDLLRRELRGKGLKFNWTSPDETMLEALLSRGDRRLSEVIFRAWERGAKFDAWREHFSAENWLAACEEVGLDPEFYVHRERGEEERLPWDHIDIGVRKKFLLEDYRMSKAGEIRPDCRSHCYACGILPKFNQLRRENPGPAWSCPDVPQKRATP